MNDSNRFFYKYIGLKEDGSVRADFLENCLFRFTQPEQLNDPFEVRPALIFGGYSAEDREWARERARKEGFPDSIPDDTIEGLFLDPGPRRRFDPKEFPGISGLRPDLRKEPFQSLEEMDRFEIAKALNEFLSTVNQNYGIFCLTTKGNSLLMWTHYAGDHRGILVGFNRDHGFFNNSADLHEVKYSKKRVAVSSKYGWLRICGQRFEGTAPHLTRVFLRKHPQWQHEAEWRMIKQLKDCEPRENNVYLFQIPNTAVTSVTFGARMSEENMSGLYGKISSDPKWSHIKIYRAELSAVHAELHYKEYALA